MAGNADSRIYIIDSFQFETKEEYEQALQEKKGISYLNAQLDANNIEKVYQLYTELVDKKIFITVVGIEYLKKLRGILLRDSRFSADKLRPIRITTVNKQVKNRVEKYISSKYETEVRQQKKEKEGIRNKLNTSTYCQKNLENIHNSQSTGHQTVKSIIQIHGYFQKCQETVQTNQDQA